MLNTNVPHYGEYRWPRLTVSDSANHIHTATVRFSSGGDQVSQNSGTTITRPYSLHCDIIPHTIWIMHTAFINERRTQGAGCQIYTRYMVSNSENTSILNVFYFNTVYFHYMVQKESWENNSQINEADGMWKVRAHSFPLICLFWQIQNRDETGCRTMSRYDLEHAGQ